MASPDRQPPSARLVRIGGALAVVLVAVGVALAVLQPGDLGADAASGEAPATTDAPKDPPLGGSATTIAPGAAPSSTGPPPTAAPPTTALPAPPGAAPGPATTVAGGGVPPTTAGGGVPPTTPPGGPGTDAAGTEAAMALTGAGSLLVPGLLLAVVAAALHRARRAV